MPAVAGKMPASPGTDEPSNCQTVRPSDRALWAQRAHKALAVPQGLVRSMADFSTDPTVLYRWRDEMADLIEEARNIVVP